MSLSLLDQLKQLQAALAPSPAVSSTAPEGSPAQKSRTAPAAALAPTDMSQEFDEEARDTPAGKETYQTRQILSAQVGSFLAAAAVGKQTGNKLLCPIGTRPGIPLRGLTGGLSPGYALGSDLWSVRNTAHIPL